MSHLSPTQPASDITAVLVRTIPCTMKIESLTGTWVHGEDRTEVTFERGLPKNTPQLKENSMTVRAGHAYLDVTNRSQFA